MDLSPLSAGAAEALCNISKSEPTSQLFVLQLLSIRTVPLTPPQSSRSPRHRVILSDGNHFFHVVLSSTIAPHNTPDLTHKYSIVGVEKVQWVYISQSDLWILAIFEMHFIEDRYEKIGKPTVAMNSPSAFRPTGT
ncbi:hypothetical protein DFH07DRAFT_289866 [Mycena maculata]|uniref:Replication factor-A protein 1 N-terminal domain-containing protein n=1 Tax=Mycena maculata TaxID=230809 RepID=A0AAD7JRA8_9AGAR|nr:hypothetical protein DFH07DRAFT_289866 [Mycena maculata]